MIFFLPEALVEQPPKFSIAAESQAQMSSYFFAASGQKFRFLDSEFVSFLIKVHWY